jgi:D-aminoacyl-tRNA deacylase
VKAVVQRVTRASASPGGQIDEGLCILLGIARDDDEVTARALAGKIARLRIFENDEVNLPPPSASAAPLSALPSASKLDRSLLDVGGAALVVSQFTLIADSKRQKGTRPDFSKAAPRDVAEPLYETFCQALRDLGVPVQTGVFGARMTVDIVNYGPVTIIIDA